MAEETKLEKIQRLLKAVQTGDQPTMDELLHPEITIHEPASLPYAGSFRGRAGLGDLFQRMGPVWSEFNQAIEFIVGDPSGDVFAVMFRIGYRSAQSGQKIEMQVLELLSFRDGRIADIKPFHWDTKALLDHSAGR